MEKRILVVDDDPTVQRFAKKILESEGFAVITANNGLEGLHAVRNNIVDVIILDIVMPVMDGVDFFKALKNSPSTANIPVIIITQKQIIEDSFRVLGVNEFLSKKTDGKKLIEKVYRVLRFSGERHHKHRVLIIGNEDKNIAEMTKLLRDNDNYVVTVHEGGEGISQGLVMVPDVLLVDIFLRDFSSPEIIKAFRSFKKLRDCQVYVFNILSSEEVGSSSLLSELDNQLTACLDVGADGYLGRFNRLTFLESFNNKVKAKE